MIEICREHSRNVKRWRDGTMALRWCAAGMPEAGHHGMLRSRSTTDDHGAAHHGVRTIGSSRQPTTERSVGAARLPRYCQRRIADSRTDQTALIMYDTETVPVNSAPAAECVTVKNGKITQSWFIFDRTPFAAARNTAS
jgi:hypothetical protein